MMKQWLENAVNRYLLLDPESLQRFAALENKIVTLEIIGMKLTVQMIFTQHNIQLKWDHFLKSDLIIRGTPLTLLHMHCSQDRQTFFQEGITVEGNMELAHEVLAVFDELEIDWEELMAKWVGDVPAHQTGRLLRGLQQFNQRICNTFSYNLNEYIHEEIHLFPQAEALNLFFHEIDELRMDVDRLTARIEQLKEKL